MTATMTELEAASFWLHQTEWAMNEARTAKSTGNPDPTYASDMWATAYEFAGYAEEAAVVAGGAEAEGCADKARGYANKARDCWNSAMAQRRMA